MAGAILWMHRPNKNPIWPADKPFATVAQDRLVSDMELSFRHLAIHLTHVGARLLLLSPAATCTACHLLHRVYCTRSFFDRNYNILSTVMACILLASKVEECPRRGRDIVNTFHFLHAYYRRDKYRPFRYTQREYREWRVRVTEAEMRVLYTCGFSVTPFHPTSLLVSYLNALHLLELRNVCQRALNYLFDSTRSVACIRHSPNTIACACINLAVVNDATGTIALPENWNIVFDVSNEELLGAIAIIQSVYSQHLDLDLPISWQEQESYTSAYYEFLQFKDLPEQTSHQPRPLSPALSYSSFSSSAE
jgi:cyclin L